LIGPDDAYCIAPISEQDESQGKQDCTEESVFFLDGISDAIDQGAEKQNTQDNDPRSERKADAVDHEDLHRCSNARQPGDNQVVDDYKGNTSQEHGEEGTFKAWISIFLEIID